jgi:hypothetical protein
LPGLSPPVKQREAAATVKTLAVVAICLVPAVYNRELTGPHHLCYLLRRREGVETLDLCLTMQKVS